MLSPHPLDCGMVPSLEVLPLMAAQRQGRKVLHFNACPGYGRILRQLLTGELQAGIVPWELFASGILTRPGQSSDWCVPLVLRAGPMELVLSRSTFRLCSPPRDRPSSKPSRRLAFAIEARSSLSRLQIATWLQTIAGAARPVFKVLPMELMLRGLAAGMMDGIVAPAPWGLLAEQSGTGSMVEDFHAGSFAQELVLVCRRSAASPIGALIPEMTAACTAAASSLQDPAIFRGVAQWAAASPWSPLTAALLEQSAARYAANPSPPGARTEFQPDAAWLIQQLDLLVHLRILGEMEVLALKMAGFPESASGLIPARFGVSGSTAAVA